MKDHCPRLMLITNKGGSSTSSYLELIESYVKSGVTSVQLREKSLSKEELLSFGTSLKNLLDLYHIPLIINDHIDLCLKLNASGVHLGQSDEEILRARAILGPDKIIGLSVNTVVQVKEANLLPLSYIGVGAIFPTISKLNVETIWGLKGLREVAAIALHPIVALGGINESNAHSVICSGAFGIAAIRAFHHTVSPHQTATQLMNNIHGEKS
ncbi:thiamine phosphate synthase [Rhabdochlamydiaceae symbiont of Dictyostelium giganteum]|uniref:thiamine phosphate synthase n=1 Tax=Rhabdochlamydiaceae symbiont of Dictyostelium giganteum TaxID=3342349 RepID=UPI00385004F4